MQGITSSVPTQSPSSPHTPGNVKQQVREPSGLPQVERAAQRFSERRAWASRQSARRSAFVAWATQLT